MPEKIISKKEKMEFLATNVGVLWCLLGSNNHNYRKMCRLFSDWSIGKSRCDFIYSCHQVTNASLLYRWIVIYSLHLLLFTFVNFPLNSCFSIYSLLSTTLITKAQILHHLISTEFQFIYQKITCISLGLWNFV